MKSKSIPLLLLLLFFVPLYGMEALKDPVDQAIQTAHENPSVDNLEHLNLLLGQFPDDSKENPKLKKAIDEVISILSHQPGVRIERRIDTSVSSQQIKIFLEKEESSANGFDVVEIDKDKLPILQESATIKEMLEDLQGCDPLQGIVLSNLTKQQFEKILSYLEDIHYINQAKKNQLFDEMKDRLQQVGEKLCQESLEDLVSLYKNANYLDIPLLLELCCQAVSILLQEPEQLEAFKSNQDVYDQISSLPKDLENTIKKHLNLIKHTIVPAVLLKKRLQDHIYAVSLVEFPDNNCLASASDDGTVCFYGIVNSKITKIKQLTDIHVKSGGLSFSPDRNYLASPFDDGTVCVHRMVNGKVGIGEQLTDHNDAVNSVVFSPDSNYLASASVDKTVCVYSIAGGKIIKIKQLTDHNDAVNSVAFSPDSNYLASASDDKTVCVYDLKQLQEVLSFLKNRCTLKQVLLFKLLVSKELEESPLHLEYYPHLYEIFSSLPTDIQDACIDCMNITLPTSYWVNRNFGSFIGGAAAIGMGAILAMNWLKR